MAKKADDASGPIVGDRVLTATGLKGEVKFVGPIQGKKGFFYGIEVNADQDGKNSGAVGDVQYFPCEDGKGVFVPGSKIKKHKPGDNADVPRAPVGSKVTVAKKGTGTVRYIGYPDFKEGIWFGVELDKPQGKNDGEVKGKRYFKCKAKHGSFTQAPVPAMGRKGSRRASTSGAAGRRTSTSGAAGRPSKAGKTPAKKGGKKKPTAKDKAAAAKAAQAAKQEEEAKQQSAASAEQQERVDAEKDKLRQIRKTFRDMDADGGGHVDLEEFKNFCPDGVDAEALFKKIDVNGNSRISFAEFDAYAKSEGLEVFEEEDKSKAAEPAADAADAADAAADAAEAPAADDEQKDEPAAEEEAKPADEEEAAAPEEAAADEPAADEPAADDAAADDAAGDDAAADDGGDAPAEPEADAADEAADAPADDAADEPAADDAADEPAADADAAGDGDQADDAGAEADAADGDAAGDADGDADGDGDAAPAGDVDDDGDAAGHAAGGADDADGDAPAADKADD